MDRSRLWMLVAAGLTPFIISRWPQHCSLTVEVAVVDNTQGTHGTSPPDAMCFVKTLTFRVPDGLAAPARPPVVTPKR